MSLADRISVAWLALRGQVPTRKRDAYKGAEVHRLLADWVTTLMHPDDEMRWNVRRMRARARDLSRNNPYARAFLNMLAVNVVGPHGVACHPQVRNNPQAGAENGQGVLAEHINRRIKEGWAEWSKRPTVDGRLSLTALSQLLVKSCARDGEIFVREWNTFEGNRFGYALEPIDPDQVDEQLNRPAAEGSGEVRLGVEVDQFGRPIGYHVWNKPDRMVGGGIGDPREQVRIPAAEVIHCLTPERVNQTRGLTWFFPVMVPLKMLAGYTEAELVASRTAAAKMGFFQKRGENSAGEIPVDPTTGNITMEANPGVIDFAPDGYEFAAWDPEHPTSQFGAFVKTMLREIASGLGVSYAALANDLESVNYSSMRSGLLIERETFTTLQEWWIDSFLSRVYRSWLSASLLSGAISLDSRDPRKYYAVKWSARRWPWVDPLKDTQAGVEGIQTGLASRTDLLAEQGKEFDEVLEALAREAEQAKQKGVDISGPSGAAGAAKENDAEDTKTKPGEEAGRLAALGLRRNGNG